MSFAWQPSQLTALPLPQLSTAPMLSQPPSSLPLPLANPLPPAPPATDLASARTHLTLHKVRLELEAVKSAWGEVKAVGEAVEAVREEVRLLKEEREAKDIAFEKRILVAVDDLLKPLSTALEKAVASVLSTVQEHGESMQARAQAAEKLAQEIGGSIGAAEERLREEVKQECSRLASAGTEEMTKLEKRVETAEKLLQKRAEEVPAMEGGLAELEKRVGAVEKQLKRVDQQPVQPSKPIPSPTTPASLPSLPRGTDHPIPSIAPPDPSSSGRSSSPSTRAQSPPSHRRSRHSHPAPPAHSTTLPSSYLSALPAATAVTGAAGGDGRTVSAPQLGSTSSRLPFASSSSSGLKSAVTLGSEPPSKRRRTLLPGSQDSVGGEGGGEVEVDMAIEGGLDDNAGAGGALSGTETVDKAGKSGAVTPSRRKRKIEQDEVNELDGAADGGMGAAEGA
ncbi:hypothetical protein JCM8097_006510 [Rhodosporidiobolus ruineniae]